MKHMIACIGNPYMGDDAIGPRIAEKLWEKGYRNIIVSGSDLAPLTSYIEDLEQLIVVDAIDMGMDPGEIIVAKLEEIEEKPRKTPHSMPPTRMLKLLKTVLNKKLDVTIIGIQPKQIRQGEKISPEIEEKLDEIIKKIEQVIKKHSLKQSQKNHVSYKIEP